MPQLYSSSALIGDDVINPEGEDMGKIEELMLDVDGGEIAYAVLSFGGFLGMGDKLFVIPWTQLRLQENEQRFVLDLPREVLENAPGFDQNSWPNFADARWNEEIDTYYGSRR